MHAHFQRNRARLFDRGGAELLGQGEDAEDAANPGFPELVINKVAECADVSTGSSGPPHIASNPVEAREIIVAAWAWPTRKALLTST